MAHGQATSPRPYGSYYAPGTQYTNIPRYTFNKYYYHNPAVSPYSELYTSPYTPPSACLVVSSSVISCSPLGYSC